MMKSILSKKQIQELLPQKHPFQMVDALYNYQSDEIDTGLTILPDNLFVEDGFFNASGLIENIAQSVALQTSYTYFINGEKAPIGYIGAISKVQQHAQPQQNSSIRTYVKIIAEFMGLTMVEGKVFQDQHLLLECKMKIFLAQDEKKEDQN